MRLGGDAVGPNHGDEDGDVPQRAALPPRHAHPQGVATALSGSEPEPEPHSITGNQRRFCLLLSDRTQVLLVGSGQLDGSEPTMWVLDKYWVQIGFWTAEQL